MHDIGLGSGRAQDSSDPWRLLAHRQHGVLALRQLRDLGVSRSTVRHRLNSGQWVKRSDRVLTTTTGPLSPEQWRWVGVLHAGPGALLTGLTAGAAHGLRNWERPEVSVLVPHASTPGLVAGVAFVRTRRDLHRLRSGLHVPTVRLEPALLLFAAAEPHPRTALGAVAASVQQRLTTPQHLRGWLARLGPLRRSAELGTLLWDLEGGSQSLNEIDVLRMLRGQGFVAPKRQRRRRDRSGRWRYTDCEWDLPDGTTLVLEVDGAFHLDVENWTADIQRQRSLSTRERRVVRCTGHEVRHEPEQLVLDLIALGVPRRSRRVA